MNDDAKINTTAPIQRHIGFTITSCFMLIITSKIKHDNCRLRPATGGGYFDITNQIIN